MWRGVVAGAWCMAGAKAGRHATGDEDVPLDLLRPRRQPHQLPGALRSDGALHVLRRVSDGAPEAVAKHHVRDQVHADEERRPIVALGGGAAAAVVDEDQREDVREAELREGEHHDKEEPRHVPNFELGLFLRRGFYGDHHILVSDGERDEQGQAADDVGRNPVDEVEEETADRLSRARRPLSEKGMRPKAGKVRGVRIPQAAQCRAERPSSATR